MLSRFCQTTVEHPEADYRIERAFKHGFDCRWPSGRPLQSPP